MLDPTTFSGFPPEKQHICQPVLKLEERFRLYRPGEYPPPIYASICHKMPGKGLEPLRA